MPIPMGRPGVAAEMRKFGAGKLRSGSPTGPVVTDPMQAKAIAMRQAGMPPPGMPRPGTPPNPPRKPGFRKKFKTAADVDTYAKRPGRRVMM